MPDDDVFDALEAEQDQLAEMLGALDDDAWARLSACSGWTVGDVVLHLAQTEEAVSATLSGTDFAALRRGTAGTVDELIDGWVRAERGAPPRDVFDRWNDARRKSCEGLKTADPNHSVTWAAAPLKPRTLATTRLAEHWIHALDIAGPLHISYPDTDRLWHIAWLAHRTIPFAFMRAGRSDPPDVRLELKSPDEESWTFGPEDADCVITGSASEFCRIAGRRLAPRDAPTIRAEGTKSAEVLELVRTYA